MHALASLPGRTQSRMMVKILHKILLRRKKPHHKPHHKLHQKLLQFALHLLKFQKADDAKGEIPAANVESTLLELAKRRHVILAVSFSRI